MGGGWRGGIPAPRGSSGSLAPPPPLQRQLVSTRRQLGRIADWWGKYGFIDPDEPVDHPSAARHGGKIFLAIEDVQDEIEGVGSLVSYFVYVDSNGVGAMHVRPAGSAAALEGPRTDACSRLPWPGRRVPSAAPAAAGGPCCESGALRRHRLRPFLLLHRLPAVAARQGRVWRRIHTRATRRGSASGVSFPFRWLWSRVGANCLRRRCGWRCRAGACLGFRRRLRRLPPADRRQRRPRRRAPRRPR
mmetsp:Transcript_111921/g.361466  ORF Transcript_111921/g.361466 Transcript_111921/m.361466 type:complete len:246 (-) Transcript_111921:1399-2136(-)